MLKKINIYKTKNYLIKLCVFLNMSTFALFAKNNDKLIIISQIEPITKIAKLITLDRANIINLMPSYGNAHTFAPKPSTLKQIKKANFYIAIDLEFEELWLNKFKQINSNLKIIKASKGIIKITTSKNEKKHIDEHSNEHDEDHHHNYDPHIWVTPKNLRKIAKNIYNEIIKKDKKNAHFYKKNLNVLIKKLDNIDKKLKELKGKKIIATNGVYKYMAYEYNINILFLRNNHENFSVKNLKKYTSKILKNNKMQQYQFILTNPVEDIKIAKLLSKQTNIKYIAINPLSGDIFNSFNIFIQAFDKK